MRETGARRQARTGKIFVILSVCMLLLFARSIRTEAAAGEAISFSLVSTDGATITESTYGDRLQLLVFYRAVFNDKGEAVCYNSAGGIQSLKDFAEQEWVLDNDLQIILVSADQRASNQDVLNFKAKYASDLSSQNTVFTYTDENLMWQALGASSVTYMATALVRGGEVLATQDAVHDLNDLKELFDGIVDFSPYYQQIQISSERNYADAFSVAAIVNENREANGLSSLTMDKDLMEAAMQRASELAAYYSHTRPSGQSCFTVSDKAYAENIAMGYTSADSVMEGWMNSTGHRANILSGDKRTIGVGVATVNGRKLWCQLFGYSGEAAAESAYPATESTTPVIQIATEYLDDGTVLLKAMKDPEEIHLDETMSVEIQCATGTVFPKSLVYTPSDPAVVEVLPSGKLVGKTVGKTTVSVRSRYSASTAPELTSFDVVVRPRDLSKATVGPISDETYSGAQIKPVPTVLYNGKKLTEGVNYTAAYEKNTNAGTATLVLKGKGEYEGTLKKTFRILPAEVDVPAAKTGLVYNGNMQTGVGEGSRYTVSGNTEKNVGVYSATVILKDKNNYIWRGKSADDQKIPWEIKAKNVSLTSVAPIADQIYTGNASSPDVTVSCEGKTLERGKDYTTEFTDNVDVGTATVAVIGKGNYTGKKTATFLIQPADIATASIAPIADQIYSASELCPALTVSRGAAVLVSGKDYTASYSNNTEVGTAAVTIKGTGNYTGTKRATFMIIRAPERNGWLSESGVWRYYTDDIALTSWQKIGGLWYFFDSDGVMQTGWQKINGSWYYFNAGGDMQQGWLSTGGKWYYLGDGTADSGYMRTGWIKDGNTWYYLDDSGAMQTGWQQIKGVWYYFSSGGAMATGWQTINGKTYFFKTSGAMAANEWCNGWWLNRDGSWTYKPRASWKKNATGWWFGDTSGWYAKNSSVTIDGQAYRFDASGYWIDAEFFPVTGPRTLKADYVANANSGIFHLASCRAVSRMAEHNAVSYSDRADVVADGYTPCKICKP